MNNLDGLIEWPGIAGHESGKQTILNRQNIVLCPSKLSVGLFHYAESDMK